MTFIQNENLKIGDRIEITQDLEVLSGTYKKGHQFTIISEDDIRGFDIRDDDGRTVYETRFSHHTFKKIYP